MAQNDHAVHVLNDLISITLDSANGYNEAAQNAENSRFKSLFETRAVKRREVCRQLQNEVRSFGGEPKDEQSLLGKLHNKFVDLKAALTGRDDKAVIDEVERGEDAIRDTFKKAARDEDLPMEARLLVERFFADIEADHDEVSRLKHQLH